MSDLTNALCEVDTMLKSTLMPVDLYVNVSQYFCPLSVYPLCYDSGMLVNVGYLSTAESSSSLPALLTPVPVSCLQGFNHAVNSDVA